MTEINVQSFIHS